MGDIRKECFLVYRYTEVQNFFPDRYNVILYSILYTNGQKYVD